MRYIEHCSDDDQTAGCAHATPVQPAAPSELATTVAKLRAFAVLLCLDSDLADELVKLTLIRASVAVSASSLGVNQSTWLISRLRTYYYGEFAMRFAPIEPQKRAAWPLPEGEHDRTLAALAKLPVKEREAMVLVDSAGYSFSTAAAICRCPPVRFRTMVNRARTTLAHHMQKPQIEASRAFAAVLSRSARVAA